MNVLTGFRERGGLTLVLASLVAATTLALAACGGSGTPSSSSTSVTPTASTSAPASASELNLPTDEVIAALEGRNAAYVRKDWQAVASYYAKDGALIEMDRGDAVGVVTVGREDLATAYEAIYGAGLRLKFAGLPLQYDGYVAAPTRISWPVGPDDAFILVLKLDVDNKFACQWVFAGGHAPSIAARPTPTPLSQMTSRPNVPSRGVVSLLEGCMAAIDGGDGEAAAACYAEHGYMIEMGGLYRRVVTGGRANIAVRLLALRDQGMRLEPASLAIQYGRLVAQPVRFSNADGRDAGAGMLVFDVNAHHRIAWQWVIGAPWMAGE